MRLLATRGSEPSGPSNDFKPRREKKIGPAATLVNRGNDALTAGRLDEAVADYDKAIDADPTSAIARYNRGNAYYSKNRFDQAIEDFTAAIELKFEGELAYLNRGITYSQERSGSIRFERDRASQSKECGNVP